MCKEKSQVIWKYPVKPEISLLIGAKIIRLEVQNDRPYFWVLCNQSITMEERKFDVIYTGQLFDSSDRKYIDTFVTCSGDLVCHVFERLNKEMIK